MQQTACSNNPNKEVSGHAHIKNSNVLKRKKMKTYYAVILSSNTIREPIPREKVVHLMNAI